MASKSRRVLYGPVCARRVEFTPNESGVNDEKRGKRSDCVRVHVVLSQGYQSFECALCVHTWLSYVAHGRGDRPKAVGSIAPSKCTLSYRLSLGTSTQPCPGFVVNGSGQQVTGARGYIGHIFHTAPSLQSMPQAWIRWTRWNLGCCGLKTRRTEKI